MTKTQEIARLDSLIKTLGSDSYLGPWLLSVKGNVELMIKSDLFPDIVPSQTAADLAKQREECRLECADKLARAQKESDRIKKEAEEYRNNVRAYARRQLEDALSKF